MTDGTNTRVDCPVCGEAFDPMAAGGWCTNSECGEWQYIGEEVPEPSEAPGTTDGGSASTNGSGDESADAEAPADALDGDDASGGGPADGATDDGADSADADVGVSDDTGSTPAEDSAGGPAVGATADVQAADERADDADTTATSEAAGPVCPACGTDASADAGFCPACGEDLSEPTVDAVEECPSCGADVEESESFCASCGEDLDAARASAAGFEPKVTDDADAGDETVAADASAPESLVLETHGEEIAVADGDTVGREARRILTDSGGDENDAVLIHREHVRFVREDGQFYVVDLGDNPTSVNGLTLSKGDREPIEPGDELELSGVVTLSVATP